MADGAVIYVEGLRELNRAFRASGKELPKAMRKRLRDAAEPVRSDAESLAVAGIARIGPRWSRMRVGVTAREVYVVPKTRGRSSRGPSRRPNLADLLQQRAMDPARDQNYAEFIREMERVLDDVADAFEKG